MASPSSTTTGPAGRTPSAATSTARSASLYYDNNGKPVVVGGNKQFIANFEYQFKIAEDFRAVLFYDAGNAWGPGSKIFNQDLVRYNNPETGVDVTFKNPRLLRSVGLELRLFLPISPAPLRFIWARKLQSLPLRYGSRTDFQFSIGTTF